MAALVCDICGGKLIVGAGGVTVCDSCGMEYSIERMREKVQEIKGVVQIDNSNMIESWMRLGDRATQAENFKEAYEYYTKIVETESENIEAIYKKGKSSIKQSTIDDIKIREFNISYKTARGQLNEQNNIREIEKMTEDYVETFVNLYERLKKSLSQRRMEYYNKRLDDYQFLKDSITNFTIASQQIEESINLIPENLTEETEMQKTHLESCLIEFLMFFGSGFRYEGERYKRLTKALPTIDEWLTIKSIFTRTLYKIHEKNKDVYTEYYLYPLAVSSLLKPCEICEFWKNELYKLEHKEECDKILKEKQNVHDEREKMGSKTSYGEAEQKAVEQKETEILCLENELKNTSIFKIKERRMITDKMDVVKQQEKQLREELNRRYDEYDQRKKELKELEESLKQKLKTIGIGCDGAICKNYKG